MVETGLYGDRLASHFAADIIPATVERSLRHGRFAATRLTYGLTGHGHTTPTQEDDAFDLCLALSPVDCEILPAKGGPRREFLPPGAFHLYDLSRSWAANVKSPFDCLHLYIPKRVLQTLADENGSPRFEALALPQGTAIVDPVVSRLGACLLPALERRHEVSELFLDQIALALQSHVAAAYGGFAPRARAGQGGLAPWQLRIATEMLNQHLDGEIALANLARDCDLSASHFSRAFARSTGLTPHRWLMRRRIELSKAMLTQTRLDLSEIALECGFADQSHFTRTFGKIAGMPPGRWRAERQG